MKKTWAIVAILLTALPLHAQLTNTFTSSKHDQSFSMGRDFWFAMPSNGWGGTNETLHIFISSPIATTAYVELGSTRNNVTVSANAVANFAVPDSWEMESSGIVEDKAIHVYSNDADLSVCFFSLGSYCSEATCIIPTIGLGNDYVVAAFASLFEGSGTSYYDYPSECVVVSTEDNTTVTIIPECNCRECTSGNENGNPDASIVAHPAGTPFIVTMDRGQSMQLMPVLATGPDNFDLTGTIIHSDKPIGVIGGSSETNIPLNVPYSNFVCEMIPPVRTWGQTYYATNFIGQPDGNALYVFLASQAGQVIVRHDCNSGDHTECVIPNQYGFYWDEIGGAQKFTSDEPFFVASYINNAGSSSGSPAEVEINPREQYTQSEVFQVLQPPASEHIGFTNYANIILNDSDEKKTLFDGKPINGIAKQCIDGNWEVFEVSNISQGVHTIMGDDSGVGVYVYGNRSSESYAWSSPEFEGTFHSPDTVPPQVDTNSQCLQGVVHLSDFGLLPDGVDTQSGLYEIRLDSVYNMSYVPDPNWIDGQKDDTSGYGFSVIDPTLPAILIVNVYDVAGNMTTVTTTYKPIVDSIKPPLNNLGVWVPSNPPNIAYDTIVNTGLASVSIDVLQLKDGNVGFSIFDSIGGPLDKSPIPAGGRRVILIKFEAITSKIAADTLQCGNECMMIEAVLLGSGGANDFAVTSQTWPNELLGSSYRKTVRIENLSSGPITIDSFVWADVSHFKADTTFPIVIPPSPASVEFPITYIPDAGSLTVPNRTQGKWFSNDILNNGSEDPRFDSLIGWAQTPSSVSENASSSGIAIIPANNGRSLEIILPSDVASPINFELVNVLGESVLRSSFTGTHSIDASELPRGVYFYRLTSDGATQNGKVILGE